MSHLIFSYSCFIIDSANLCKWRNLACCGIADLVDRQAHWSTRLYLRENQVVVVTVALFVNWKHQYKETSKDTQRNLDTLVGLESRGVCLDHRWCGWTHEADSQKDTGTGLLNYTAQRNPLSAEEWSHTLGLKKQKKTDTHTHWACY